MSAHKSACEMKKCLASECDERRLKRKVIWLEKSLAAATAGKEAAQEEAAQEEAALAAVKCRRLFTLHKAKTKSGAKAAWRAQKQKFFFPFFATHTKLQLSP